MKRLMLAAALAIALAGCILPHQDCEDCQEKAKLKSDKTSAVVVGVENGFAGKCSGSLKDASSMKSRLSIYSSKVTVLTDKSATAAKVKAAFEEAVKNDLAIFYFSGHGGTHKFDDTGKEEADGSDEFICCYDTYVRDNDIWNIICKSKGRVMLIFDCCHSETMYRQSGFMFSRASKLAEATTLLKASPTPNMLCWSGCPDSKYSYGTANGGKMTKAIKTYTASSSTTYDKAWKKVAADKEVKKWQTVKQTKLGKFDTAKTKIFR